MTTGLAIVGGAAGAYLGGPVGASIGMQGGALIGELLGGGSGKRQDIGKLSDLKYSGSSYGAGIPIVMGKGRVGGSVVWGAKNGKGEMLIDHKKKVGGGKGGAPEGTQHTYTATVAVGLCAGSVFCPDPSHPLGGTFISLTPNLDKLWGDDILIYDRSKSKNVIVPTWHSGSEVQGPDATIVAKSGLASSLVTAFPGLAYPVLVDLSLTPFNSRIPNFSAEVSTAPVDLADVFLCRCRAAGILLSELDASAGVGVMVDGFATTGRSTAEADLAPTLLAYGFDAVEVDGVLRLVRRGGAATFAISAADLGATSGSGAVTMERSRGAGIELPGRMEVAFYDLSNSYLAGSLSVVRQSSDIQNTEQLQLPLALMPDVARPIAGRELDRRHSETESYAYSLPMSRLGIAPGDVGTVPVNGVDQRVRVTGVGLAPIGELKFGAVLDEAAIWTQPTAGGGSGAAVANLTAYPSIWRVWSGAEVRDADQATAGFYVAATGADGWSGCTVFYSLDGGATWIEGPAITGECVFGTTTGALSAAGAAMDAFDDANAVGVDLTASFGALSNAPDSAILAGSNHAVIGGEIVGIGAANLTAANRYNLSHLRRGERSTPMTGHAAGELFVLLNYDVVRVNVADGFVGSTVLVKCVSRYEDLTDVSTSQSVVIAPRTLTKQEQILNTVVFPRFLSAPIAVIVDEDDAADWATIDVSADVPATAQALIVEAQLRMNAGGGAYVRVRPNALASDQVLIYGRANGSGDDVGGFNRGDYPLDSGASYRRFDIKLDLGNGFDGRVNVRVVGYWG